MQPIKPQQYDNSWLGNTCNIAVCFDKNNKIVCTTLDAPNPVAYAVQKYNTITRVNGLLGNYNIKEMKVRLLCKEYLSNYQKYIKLIK